jgi:hypothetical protein
MAATHRPLLYVALAALAAAGCDGTARTIAGDPSTGGAFHADTWSSPSEHGTAAMTGLGACGACHGQDFSGGTSGVSCNACHADAGHPGWETDCTFCHESPPITGEHRKHVTDKRLACASCHAEVVSGSDTISNPALHVNGTTNVNFGGAGSWNPSTRTCSNVGCHGSESW